MNTAFYRTRCKACEVCAGSRSVSWYKDRCSLMKSATRLSLLALLAWLCAGFPAMAQGGRPVSAANTTILGPNVFVFDPSMPMTDIQKTATDIFKKMEANQFGPERYALLFKPGAYDVTFNVGFYTHVAGLGLRPGRRADQWRRQCQRQMG